MGRSNIELIHEVLEIYEREGFAALAPYAHPDVEIRNETNVLEAGDYRGIDEGVAMNARWEEVWADQSYEYARIEELDGETLVAEVALTLRGSGSGAAVTATQWWVFGIRDGRFTRWHLYMDRESAMGAARR